MAEIAGLVGLAGTAWSIEVFASIGPENQSDGDAGEEIVSGICGGPSSVAEFLCTETRVSLAGSGSTSESDDVGPVDLRRSHEDVGP